MQKEKKLSSYQDFYVNDGKRMEENWEHWVGGQNIRKGEEQERWLKGGCGKILNRKMAVKIVDRRRAENW
jgi:hypothetical protein